MADDGLVIIGVHTPEFEFEKVYDNEVEATQNQQPGLDHGLGQRIRDLEEK